MKESHDTTTDPAPRLEYAVPVPRPEPTALARALRVVAGLTLLPVAGLCGFGLLASGELPWPAAAPWAIAYGGAGAGALIGSGVLFYRAIAGVRASPPTPRG